MLEIAMKQNRIVQGDMGMKLYDFDKLYGQYKQALNNRGATIRWVKIPTFTKENKHQHHTVFLVNIDYWSKNDLNLIYRLCRRNASVDGKDDYTIFLCGRQKGFHFPNEVKGNLRKYNMFVINNNARDPSDASKTVFQILYKNLDKRLLFMQQSLNRKKIKLFAILKKDYERLKELTRYFYKLWRNFTRIFMKLRIEKAKERRKEITGTSNIRMSSSFCQSQYTKSAVQTAKLFKMTAEVFKNKADKLQNGGMA